MRKSDLPKQLKIGPYVYHVVPRGEDWYDDQEAVGQCNHTMMQIDIVTTRKYAFVLDTLIHEIQHAIWFFMDIKDEDKEEDIVRRMATGWTQIYLENPDLLKFINKAVKMGREDK